MLASFHNLRERLYQTTLLAGTIVFSGCLSMGLPERFSSQTTRTETRPSLPSVRALLLDSNSPALAKSQRETLGNQFVLGLVPLTRLYFEHGVTSLVRELSHEILLQNDILVGETRKEFASIAAEYLSPQLMLSPQITALSTNAYDLLLARYVVVAGDLTLDVYGPDFSPLPIARHSEKLTFDEFRRAAHAPTLGYAVEKTIATSLRPMLERELSHLRQFPRRLTLEQQGHLTRARAMPSNSRLLVIPPLQLSAHVETAIKERLGEIFAKSYGFASVTPFSPAMVARVVTLGIELAATELAIPTLLLSHTLPGGDIGTWEMRVKVLDVAWSGSETDILTLTLHLSLFEVAPRIAAGSARERQPDLLKELNCKVAHRVDHRHDGALIATLSKAAAAIATTFFDQPTGEDRAAENWAVDNQPVGADGQRKVERSPADQITSMRCID